MNHLRQRRDERMRAREDAAAEIRAQESEQQAKTVRREMRAALDAARELRDAAGMECWE